MKKKQIWVIAGVLIIALSVFYFTYQKQDQVCSVSDVVLTSESMFTDAELPANLKSEDKVHVEVKNDCEKLDINVELYREYVEAAERLTSSIKSVNLMINGEAINSVVIDSQRLATANEIYEFRVQIKEFEYAGNTYSSTFEFKMILDGYELTNVDEILVKK